MTAERSYLGYPIDTIYDDDGTTVIGYDVREPDSTVDDPPMLEMVRTIAECRDFIRDDAQFRRMFGRSELV